ncbi:MAG: efflux RND transporter periplasmic adaptor subunit [Woeseiaceae bacterium]
MTTPYTQTPKNSGYRLKRYLVIFAILGFAVLVMAGLILSKKAPVKKPRDVTAPLVETLPVIEETIQFFVDSQGVVAPLTETLLSAEVSGAIVGLSDALVAGGRFSSGDVLLRIDPVNYEVAVERAEATMAQRQIEYDGAKRLGEQGYRSTAELSSAKAALAAAKADVVRAKQDMQRTVVRAPYDGLVRSRSTDLGNFVNVGAELATIFATDIAEVRLALPDADLAFIELPSIGSEKAGPSVTLSGSHRGAAAEWVADIARTEGVVDERTRMTFVVARVRDPYGLSSQDSVAPELPMGTFVTARINGIEVSDLIRIPRELVRANNQVIFVDEDSKLRFRNLNILRTDEQYAYVSADQVVENLLLATRLEAPLNGMLVRSGDDVADKAPKTVETSSGEGASQGTDK